MILKAPFADDFAKYHMKGSPDNPMGDKELRRKKGIQSKLALTTATTGLTSLGLVTAAGIARKKPGVFRVAPENAEKVASGLKDKGYAVGSVGAGVSGLAGINFASIQRAEANKRRATKKISKAYNAYTGTESKRYTPKLAFNAPDPENNRERRQAAYTPALGAAGVGAIAARNKIGRAAEKTDVKASNKLRNSNVARLARIATETRDTGDAFEANKEPLKAAKASYKSAKTDYKIMRQTGANKKARKPYKKAKAAAKAAKDTAKQNFAIDQKTASRLNTEHRVTDKISVDTANKKYLEALRKPTITSSPKAFKRGKQGAIIGGAGLIALGVGNEIHRQTGGKSYKGHFDKYKN